MHGHAPVASKASAPKASKATVVESSRWRALEAAISYFMVILTVSWVFGPVREFFVRAGADPMLGTLSQAVATLLLLTYAAGWVVRSFSVPPLLSFRLGVGLGAVALFLACDALSAYLMFDVSPPELALGLLSPEGVIIGLVLLVATILPALRSRSAET